MGISIQKLTSLYILTTFLLFLYTFNEIYRKADNYFSASIIYLDDVITNFIFYNMIFSIGILFYKFCLWTFFQQLKENQTIKMLDKLKAKIIDVILFCYILDGEIQIHSFSCIVFIFFSYVMHCMAIFRADYLVHTPANLSLNLNYRLTALFLIIAFFDYEMLCYSSDLLYSESATHFIFAYYTIIISLSIIEPIIRYFIDFYEKYTLCHINNIDEHLATISLVVSVPRLLIQICLSICLAVKFNIFFYLIFTIIELVSQLTHVIKSYNRIKKLTDTMKNLKRITQQQIKQHHDNTCMVCFQDMIDATLLPCKHFFHDQCLRQWIIKNSNHFCPKCKKEFNFDNKTEKKVERNQERERILNERQMVEKLRAERIKRLEKMEEKLNKVYRLKQKKKQQNSSINQDRMRRQENEHIQNQVNEGENIQNQKQKQKKNRMINQEENHQEKRQQPYMKQDLQSHIQKLKNKLRQTEEINSHKQKLQTIKHQHKISSNQNIEIMDYDTPLQIVNKRNNKQQYLRIGSLQFGLPTEAVYRRNYRHMYIRDKYQRANQQLIRDFSSMEYQQMMLFADN